MKKTIYITDKTRKELKKITNKYQVSISTIANVLLTKVYTKCFMKAQLKDLKNVYLINDPRYQNKTSIKLTNEDYVSKLDDFKPHLSKLITNLLYVYTERDINKFFNEPNLKQIINNELANKKEIYWNLNQVIRTQRRALSILGAKKHG